MTTLAGLTRSRVFLALLLATTALHAAAFLPYLFLDHDVIIYSLIGEALYREGAIPYEVAFDHKPILTYVLYGPLALLDAGFNIYALNGLLWLAALALFLHLAPLGRRLPFALVLFVILATTLGNVGYTGNTEVIFVPLQIVAVVLMLGSAGRPWHFLLSAAAATAAFNVNYVAGMSLLPALLYGLWRSGPGLAAFIRRTLLYGLLCLALIGLLFALMALGGGDVAGYLDMQRRFLTGYDARYGASRGFRLTVLACFGLIALSYLPVLRPAPADRPLRDAMALLVVFAVAAFVINSKYFAHYLLMCTAPSALILMLLACGPKAGGETGLDRRGAPGILGRAGLALLAAGLAVYHIVTAAAALTGGRVIPDQRIAYAPIAEMVGEAPLMSMGSSIVPLYYSERTPFQPIVWHNHAQIIHRGDADAYYVEMLARAPAFVMTGIDFCTRWAVGWDACTVLEEDYTPELAAENLERWLPGYIIWQRRAD